LLVDEPGSDVGTLEDTRTGFELDEELGAIVDFVC